MDIITDLSARTVSFFVTYQEICRALNEDCSLVWPVMEENFIALPNALVTFSSTYTHLERSNEKQRRENAVIRKLEILRSTKTGLEDLPIFLDQIRKLCEILRSHHMPSELDLFEKHNPGEKPLSQAFRLAAFSGLTKHNYSTHQRLTLDDIREKFRYLLYKNNGLRQNISYLLEYIPVLVILALDEKGRWRRDIPLFQIWGSGAKRLSGWQLYKYDSWWTEERRTNALLCLENLTILNSRLLKYNVALPFETLFNIELDEIALIREKKWKSSDDYSDEPANSSKNAVPELDEITNGEQIVWKRQMPMTKDEDPLVRALNSDLRGLAFSGGGIRSATFNLGVLQKLAILNRLKHFDYISTVSGGGYIGSWFITWLYRLGSVDTIMDLLNPRTSNNPSADEVRPIRWLRMYSNYLAPMMGLMSTDSITMGLTWLRNTIINQLLLLLMLCTALAFVATSFELWNSKLLSNGYYDISSSGQLLSFSLTYTVSAALLLSIGLRRYYPDKLDEIYYLRRFNKNLPLLIGLLTGSVSLIVSSWLKTNLDEILEDKGFQERIKNAAAISVLIGMSVIAILGKYHSWTKKISGKLIFMILLSTLATSKLASLLIPLSWNSFDLLRDFSENDDVYHHKLIFIFGPAIIMGYLAILVITRMALMGVFFPDSRREWWGRMGAVMHRVVLMWVLLASCGLIMDKFIEFVKEISFLNFPTLVGGWSVIVGWAVKTAFDSDEKGDKANNKWGIKDVFVRAAPYLFLVGFLMIGSTVFDLLREKLDIPDHATEENCIPYLKFLVILAIITALLSFTVGVNEFSLYHFYRNRLTRAYLGASRKRESRKKTANEFTGFDDKDDLAISRFTTSRGYAGPYPIINTTMNSTTVSELDRQDRMAESFIFTPKFCGYDFSTTRSAAGSSTGVFQYGYRETIGYSEPNGPTIGSAMAISGAAVNPSMGYHSSAPTAFLLTLFNVRLGKWIGNPRLGKWKRSDPEVGLGYLIYDLLGKSDINKEYVSLSDGGHFDNMGVYELIRRRCSYIMLCDAEEDSGPTFEGLANLVRRCRIDFGVEIEINIDPLIWRTTSTGRTKTHIVSGNIYYPGIDKPARLVYLKSSLSSQESVDVNEYHANNNEFPQESTGDQFFTEGQFESYRKLGFDSIPG
ncbi:patatin-like phospholipase family protein [Pedobacter sp. G11]|uniref:patatin-like phospholipase family protein n=1 Tax=Pedobacter sp. G11 TaxID=2482728 RepID=UPI000F60452D|nr:patatin-like phospholipase family protein [Pedobacter sp. G11]AZI26658.1 patatin-like phospholipase family protein [Pedobacter sp. G11]